MWSATSMKGKISAAQCWEEHAISGNNCTMWVALKSLSKQGVVVTKDVDQVDLILELLTAERMRPKLGELGK